MSIAKQIIANVETPKIDIDVLVSKIAEKVRPLTYTVYDNWAKHLKRDNDEFERLRRERTSLYSGAQYNDRDFNEALGREAQTLRIAHESNTRSKLELENAIETYITRRLTSALMDSRQVDIAAYDDHTKQSLSTITCWFEDKKGITEKLNRAIDKELSHIKKSTLQK